MVKDMPQKNSDCVIFTKNIPHDQAGWQKLSEQLYLLEMTLNDFIAGGAELDEACVDADNRAGEASFALLSASTHASSNSAPPL